MKKRQQNTEFEQYLRSLEEKNEQKSFDILPDWMLGRKNVKPINPPTEMPPSNRKADGGKPASGNRDLSTPSPDPLGGLTPSEGVSLFDGVTREDERELQGKEVVIGKNGRPRQAGSGDYVDGEFIKRFKGKAEKSLYLFAKAVLNRFFLTPTLHRPVCQFIQQIPPHRKLIMMPREHAKTAIVSGALPLHIIIQPAEGNIYFPGLEGCECRILLSGETESMAKKNLRVLEEVHTGNKLFRALWPERVWDNARRQSKVWSAEALIFPRKTEWPDPTIWAKGVGGAVTGSRPNVLLKDDLVSFKAANSQVVMEEAIEWHKVSRALLDTYEVESGLHSLEFIIGTRWATYDLYSYIQDNDPSVAVIDERFHSIIRDGRILWPEKHTKESIQQLRDEHGSMFYLLYMNSAANPELTSFDYSEVRRFHLTAHGDIVFDEDDRDEKIKAKLKRAKGLQAMGAMQFEKRDMRGKVLNSDRMEELLARRMQMRFRAT